MFIGTLHFISYHQKDHNFSQFASSAQTHFKMMEQPEMLETHFFSLGLFFEAPFLELESIQSALLLRVDSDEEGAWLFNLWLCQKTNESCQDLNFNFS